MADSPLKPWLDSATSRIPSVIQSVLEAEILHVINEFCVKGLPWIETLENRGATAGDRYVEVNPVDGRRKAIYVQAVYWKQTRLGDRTAQIPLYNATGTPKYFTCDTSPSIITLIPAPDASTDSDLTIVAAFAPKCPEEWMPDLFKDYHFEAIEDGVLGRMYNHHARPYSNASLALYHLKRFRQKCNEARDMSRRGNTPAAAAWAYPAFGV